MQMRTELGVLALVSALTLGLTGCGGESTPTEIVASGELPFSTLTVSPVSAQRERIWDGVIEAVNQATLSAQTGGRVREVLVDVNDYVKAGDVILRFTDVEQQSAIRQAQAALAAAKAALDEQKRRLTRRNPISSGSARSLDGSWFRKRSWIRRRRAVTPPRRSMSPRKPPCALPTSRLTTPSSADYTVVRAPYSGIVTQRHVEVGEAVNPGQPLISGLSLDKLRVNVQIPQSDMASIREHAKASLLLADGKRIDAEQVIVFPYADPTTHTFSVRLELPQAETGLQPGMTAKAAFVIGASERLLVPESALVRRSEVTADAVRSLPFTWSARAKSVCVRFVWGTVLAMKSRCWQVFLRATRSPPIR